jgi:serine/threonine protein kinase
LDEFFKDYNFKIGKILTQIGFYIASQLFIEILECVQFLHTQNIIHRDLNPNNIMLKREVNNRRFIKIADFGIIAIHKYPDRSHTTDIGTHRYMAPEVSYDSKYGTIADIYSLGVVLMKLFHIDVHE